MFVALDYPCNRVHSRSQAYHLAASEHQGNAGFLWILIYGRIYGATLHKDHFRHLLSTPQRVSAYVLGAALYNVLRIYTKKNASNYFKFTIFRRDAHSNFKN